MKSQNTVEEALRCSFELLFQREQTLFTQEFSAVSKSVDESGYEALIEPHKSSSEREAGSKICLIRLVDNARTSPETNVWVFETGGTDSASEIDLLN